jgi:transketolase
LTSEQLAWKIRRHGIEMTHISQGSHIGAILSVADIIAVLYNDIANVDPADPKMPDRDRIILSKGHAGAAIYAALAEKGFFKVEELKTHYADGSRLSGHVSHKGIPGVEFSTGSLGHGLSVGAGMAYGAKKDNKQHKVFVICGDGECDEGAVWEAALVANHYKLNNLVAVIDHNKMQSLDFCENTITLSPFADKWRAFGWNVIDIDGHDHDALRDAFIKAKESIDKPTVIIANTTKGKGISFMENDILWHYRFPHEGEEYNSAVAELRAQMPEGITDMYGAEESFKEVAATKEVEEQKL